MVYSGSKDGWDQNAFDLCKDKGSTVTFYQILNGDCIGAFTETERDLTKNYDKSVEFSSKVFNLT
jgi:hypothetical protein